MTDADVRARFDAVLMAIGVPSVARPSLDGDDARDGAGTQRIATTQIDDLLRRVAELTTVISVDGRREWDDVDCIAARLLLADLAAIASTTRALNELAAARLRSALAALATARRDTEHSLQEIV